jgi:hypothetical protein
MQPGGSPFFVRKAFRGPRNGELYLKWAFVLGTHAMFDSDGLRNSTSLGEILYVGVILFLAGTALYVLMQLVGLNPASLLNW